MDGRIICEILGGFSPGARKNMVQSMKTIWKLNNGVGEENKWLGVKFRILSTRKWENEGQIGKWGYGNTCWMVQVDL